MEGCHENQYGQCNKIQISEVQYLTIEYTWCEILYHTFSILFFTKAPEYQVTDMYSFLCGTVYEVLYIRFIHTVLSTWVLRILEFHRYRLQHFLNCDILYSVFWIISICSYLPFFSLWGHSTCGQVAWWVHSLRGQAVRAWASAVSPPKRWT